MSSASRVTSHAVDQRQILRVWWPLAASWMLMGAELPLLSAVVGRMPDAHVHLGAYSSLVLPTAFAIEAPIIMLLAASTALCVDWKSYVHVRRFMLIAGALLTVLHVVIAFTPLFDVLASRWIGVPPELVEPGRIGLRILTPWTWSIAYRRFQQGVLIRFDRSRLVTAGTAVRVLANAVVLGAGYFSGRFSGIVVGASAVSAGVVSEALFVGVCVQGVLHTRLKPAPESRSPLTNASFLRFYLPLALTPLVTLLAQPIGAAAMSRMPQALPSLATWPAYHGLVFLFRALGLAFNEVVVALIGEERGPSELRRFGWRLALATAVALALVAVTPLGRAWFVGWSDLEPELATLGRNALVFALFLPALNVAQSYFQGALVHERRTRAITESVVLSLTTTTLGLVACVTWQRFPALPCAAAMLCAGNLFQTLWLRVRARSALERIETRSTSSLANAS